MEKRNTTWRREEKVISRERGQNKKKKKEKRRKEKKIIRKIQKERLQPISLTDIESGYMAKNNRVVIKKTSIRGWNNIIETRQHKESYAIILMKPISRSKSSLLLNMKHCLYATHTPRHVFDLVTVRLVSAFPLFHSKGFVDLHCNTVQHKGG